MKTVEPMLARAPEGAMSAQVLLVDDDWAFDVKADGIRVIVVIAGGVLKAFSRTGKTVRLPAPVTIRLGSLLDGDYVLDGELVGTVLYLFDVVSAGAVVGAGDAWSVRRAALNTVLSTWPLGGAVRGIPYATGIAGKQKLVAAVAAGHGEGLVAKRTGSSYQAGKRSRDWLKIKRHHEIDCVITWLGVDKANMGVAVYDGDRLVEIAEVGRLTGDGPRCSVGDVVSVRCLYSTDANRLVQPTLPRLRYDKAGRDCGIDQLDAARTNPRLLDELTTARPN